MKQILESLSVILIPIDLKNTFALILWCLFFAVVGALIYMGNSRRRTIKAILALQKAEAFSEEKGKSAVELFGKELDFLERKEERLISRSDEEIPRYWIPEENRKKAEYYVKAASGSPWMTLLGVVGLYAVLVAVYYILPLLLGSFSL